eukprot:CAMPEP_0170734192 /NCGR_PEP_ID=MMETSP0437-20130122/2465_1 /TAXON_ID=0 /ORGANISM="Sexangularia sp." /LENGTH=82 /DNA_ID=CAMNT_0011072501 /DNA_START=81 /DNA_END=326 /DNA_ORIENTATION=-
MAHWGGGGGSTSRMGHVNTRAEVLEAFKVFDAGNKGYLTTQELQRVLNDLGEMMGPGEVQELLGESASSDGNVYYEQVLQQW